MQVRLLKYLCDPTDKTNLTLEQPVYDSDGNAVSGVLVSESGNKYTIRDGIPRFIEKETETETKTVESFGDEWNYFNFDQFKANWLEHTIRNTFGSPSAFEGKVIVDAGAGSGMQSKWMSEAGAKYVISLEMSHSVDDVMKRNLEGRGNVDIVQCSIDHPPIRNGAIGGIVICHNVIQHTRSVEDTAHALWRIVGKGGEFVFNCYPKNDAGFVRKARLKLYELLRHLLSRRSFRTILNYSRVMSVLRFVPLLGWFLEKSSMMVRGDVPKGSNRIKRSYVAGVLNTFDCYGSHAYQHLKSDAEIRKLIAELQPDPEKILNVAQYFLRPPPIGCALRLTK